MRFTVFTPTFNRAHTLHRVYESLSAQTFRDFEWLIVDDGSTDATGELVGSWEPTFPVRYLWKPNGGKHTAVNFGMPYVRGEFTVFLDSDNYCTPNALDRFDYHWREIPDPSQFSTLCCLCARPDGTIIGEPYPAAVVDSFTFAEQWRFRAWERWGINRTDMLRMLPYPEGERWVPDGLIWNRLSRKYAARYFNEALQTYEIQPDSLMRSLVDLRASNPKASLTYYKELALSSLTLSARGRAAINYCRFAALAAGRLVQRLWKI